MMLTKTGWMAGVAALAVGVLGSVAQAGEAEDLARACIHHINHQAARAVDHMGVVAKRTAMKIRELDEAGATDEEIIEVARHGHRRVVRIQREATKRTFGMVKRCVAELEELGAEDELINKVKRAGRRAKEKIDAGAENAHAIIRRVTHWALNN